MPPGSIRIDSIPSVPTLKEYCDSLMLQLEMVKNLNKEHTKYDCYPNELPKEYLDLDHDLSILICNLQREAKNVNRRLKDIKKLIDLAPFK